MEEGEAAHFTEQLTRLGEEGGARGELSKRYERAGDGEGGQLKARCRVGP
jgi:hypothetical protein